jgi:hypothetical protein
MHGFDHILDQTLDLVACDFARREVARDLSQDRMAHAGNF